MATPALAELHIGVDGGGTKTAISVASRSGAILASLVVGSTNPNSVGDAGAARTLNEGIQALVAQIHGDIANVRSVVLSISGCNSAADGLRMCTWLTPLFPNAWSTLPGSPVSAPPAGDAAGGVLVQAYNDSIAALVSGTGGALEGIVLISGTGMICKGFHKGQEWTAGGNGALIDGGSGYSIGINVARAAFAAHDGMGPHSPLLASTLHFLGLDRAEQIVDWLYMDSSWARIATLAPLAFRAAEGDASAGVVPDPVAIGIVQGAADFLVRSVKAVSDKLHLAIAAAAGEVAGPVTVVCAGGLLQNAMLLELVTRGVHAFLPSAKLVHPAVSPSEGAALLALSQWNTHHAAHRKAHH